MLNAVKHLYRIVERMRNGAIELFSCTRRNRRLSLVSGFQYSLLLLCLLLSNTGIAQVYTLKTLDGTSATIKLRYKPFTKYLTISCATDKLILHEYWGPGEIKVINKKFLKIKYYIRGGSGIGLGNTLLLCVSHGKLWQAMHIESYSSNLNYSADLDSKRTTQKIIDARLALDIADNARIVTYDTLVTGENKNFRRSSATPKKDVIRFNLARCIFYNYQKNFNVSLIEFIYNSNHTITTKKHFTGMAPAFQLNNLEYIFVDSKWYIESNSRGEYFLAD